MNKEQQNALALCKTKFQKNLVLGLANIGGASVDGPGIIYCKGDKEYVARCKYIGGVCEEGTRCYRKQATRIINLLIKNEIKFWILFGPKGGVYNARLIFDEQVAEKENKLTLEKLLELQGKVRVSRDVKYA